MNDIVEKIKSKAMDMFVELGCKIVRINEELVYEKKGVFYKFAFIKGFKSFVVEYAENIDEAQKNRYEDGDLFPLSLGEEKLIEALRGDLIKYYFDD